MASARGSLPLVPALEPPPLLSPGSLSLSTLPAGPAEKRTVLTKKREKKPGLSKWGRLLVLPLLSRPWATNP